MKNWLRLCDVRMAARPFRAAVWWLCLLAGATVAVGAGIKVGDGATTLVPALLFWTVLVYPLLEEIVFRGALQGWLRERLRMAWGPLSLANLLTSIAFAITHVMVWGHVGAALVFLPSLAFGWTRDAHATLSGAVVLHMAWNLAFAVGQVVSSG